VLPETHIYNLGLTESITRVVLARERERVPPLSTMTCHNSIDPE